MQFGDTARICFNKQFICQVGWILTIISLWRLYDWDLLTREKYAICSYGFKIFWVSIESCWLMMRHALYGWRLVEITGFQYLLSLYTMTICCRGRLWVCRSIYQPSTSRKKTLSISSMILKSALPADHQLIGSKFYTVSWTWKVFEVLYSKIYCSAQEHFKRYATDQVCLPLWTFYNQLQERLTKNHDFSLLNGKTPRNNNKITTTGFLTYSDWLSSKLCSSCISKVYLKYWKLFSKIQWNKCIIHLPLKLPW